MSEVGKGCRHTDQPREYPCENEEEFLQDVHASISAGKTTHISYLVPLFLQVYHEKKYYDHDFLEGKAKKSKEATVTFPPLQPGTGLSSTTCGLVTTPYLGLRSCVQKQKRYCHPVLTYGKRRCSVMFQLSALAIMNESLTSARYLWICGPLSRMHRQLAVSDLQSAEYARTCGSSRHLIGMGSRKRFASGKALGHHSGSLVNVVKRFGISYCVPHCACRLA